MCILQESTTRLVLTTWDESTFSLQRVVFKMSLGNAWNSPCRSCFFAFAASSDFFKSVTNSTRRGFNTFQQASQISRSRRFAPPTNLPNLREDFWSKRDRLERQGLLLLSDREVDNRVVDMGTPIVEARPQFYCRHPFHFESSDRAVACIVVIDVILSSFSETRHPSGHDISARGRRRCNPPRFLRRSRKRSEDTAFQN